MKNEKLFKQYMTALSEIHGKELSALLNSIYWKVLEPFRDQECEKAFKELILSAKFFPKPADILEILRGRKEDQAALAWIKVSKALARIGNYQSVKFSDPVIHSALDAMGGWINAGSWRVDEMKWKQREFERLYAIMARNDKHPAYLVGITERDNAANGYEIESKIIKIGAENSEKAQITHEMRAF